jgi:hypothetical protein
LDQPERKLIEEKLMAKVFYTERDIEDMAKRGERSLVVTEDVVLTDLAYETARKLGVELCQPHDTPPGAPVRPYLNQPSAQSAPAPAGLLVSPRLESIMARVKTAVKTQLGNQVDDATLERIISRVASDLGLK